MPRPHKRRPTPKQGPTTPWDVRMADGLVEICATSDGGAGPPPQLSVHADLQALTVDSGLSELAQGPVIANETARRLACDAVVETVVHDGNNLVVGVGRNQRTVPGWLRRLLEHRDHHCRFPRVRSHPVDTRPPHSALGGRRPHRP